MSESKNEVKLQILISKKIYDSLIKRISENSLKNRQKSLSISAHVRELILHDLRMEK